MYKHKYRTLPVLHCDYIKFLCICVQSVISTNNIQLLTYVEMDIAVLLNSKLHIGEHEVKVNKIKFIVQ